MNKRIQTPETVKLKRRAGIAFAFYIAAVLMATLATTTCLAAIDPLYVLANYYVFSKVETVIIMKLRENG